MSHARDSTRGASGRHQAIDGKLASTACRISFDAKAAGAGENSGEIDNLTWLRSWNDTLEVRVFTAFKGSSLTFSLTCDATLLLLLLFLFAGTFSLAFVHAFSSSVSEIVSAVDDRNAVGIGDVQRAHERRAGREH
jgi:hypothetical protein